MEEKQDVPFGIKGPLMKIVNLKQAIRLADRVLHPFEPGEQNG
jgi:hypothetical protein